MTRPCDMEAVFLKQPGATPNSSPRTILKPAALVAIGMAFFLTVAPGCKNPDDGPIPYVMPAYPARNLPPVGPTTPASSSKALKANRPAPRPDLRLTTPPTPSMRPPNP